MITLTSIIQLLIFHNNHKRCDNLIFKLRTSSEQRKNSQISAIRSDWWKRSPLGKREDINNAPSFCFAKPGINEPRLESSLLASKKYLKISLPGYFQILPGGRDRIRTCETFASLHAFQACSFNHSDTLPSQKLYHNPKNL